jgi:hypothetical protein
MSATLRQADLACGWHSRSGLRATSKSKARLLRVRRRQAEDPMSTALEFSYRWSLATNAGIAPKPCRTKDSM